MLMGVTASLILACMVVILWWRVEALTDRVAKLERFQEAWRAQQELAREEAHLDRSKKRIPVGPAFTAHARMQHELVRKAHRIADTLRASKDR